MISSDGPSSSEVLSDKGGNWQRRPKKRSVGSTQYWAVFQNAGLWQPNASWLSLCSAAGLHFEERNRAMAGNNTSQYGITPWQATLKVTIALSSNVGQFKLLSYTHATTYCLRTGHGMIETDEVYLLRLATAAEAIKTCRWIVPEWWQSQSDDSGDGPSQEKSSHSSQRLKRVNGWYFAWKVTVIDYQNTCWFIFCGFTNPLIY